MTVRAFLPDSSPRDLGSSVRNTVRRAAVRTLTLVLSSIVCTLSAAAADNVSFIVEPGKVEVRGRIVLLVEGSDPAYAHVFEDALSMLLQREGWDVVDRRDVSRAMAEELGRLSQAAADTSGVSDVGVTQESIASKLDARYYLTGTVVFGRKQHMLQYDDRNTSIEKVAVTSIAYRIIDRVEDTVAQSAVLDFVAGEGFTYAARRVAGIVTDGD